MPGMSGLELFRGTRQQIAIGTRCDHDRTLGIYKVRSTVLSVGHLNICPNLLTSTKRSRWFNVPSRTQKKKEYWRVPDNEPEPEIIGKAPAMQEVFRAIGRLSSSDVSVLINGPIRIRLKSWSPKRCTSTARAQTNRFIALNVAAIPDDLIESELFGHEKGAFTGATQLRQGRFEQANEGTLFLDEIGDMPATAQTRLLRVLAENEFYRVGGHQSVKVNVRIVAATHQNLEARVEQGRFREDLISSD